MGPDGFRRLPALLGVAAVVIFTNTLAVDATASEPLLQDAAGWAIVAGSGERTTKADLRWRAQVDGNLCTHQGSLGSGAVVDGVLAATRSGGLALLLRSIANVTGDVITGGGSVAAAPKNARLPGLSSFALPPGRRVERRDGGGLYDTTGNDPLGARCARAQAAVADASRRVAEMESVEQLPAIALRAGETATISAALAGQVNVIDVPSVRLGSKATLRLDGLDHPETVVVLRVSGRLRTRLGSSISLAGGLTPSRVLIHVARGSCNLGDRMTGSGALLCRDGNLLLGARSTWTGELLGGGAAVVLGASARVESEPFGGL